VAAVLAGLKACVTVVTLFAQPAIARPLTPADTLAPRDLGEIAVAPDGHAIAFTVTTNNAQANSVTTRLMLLQTSGEPRQIAEGASRMDQRR